jgi:predicted nucleic acid-binding protein
MKAYLDSSVILRSLLRERGAFEDWSHWELTVTSELMRVEVFRAIDRLRVLGRLNEAQLADTTDSLRALIAGVSEITLQTAVLQRAAAPFSSMVSALDAIHIASALLWIEEQADLLVFVTHDAQQAVAARLAGLQVQTAP